MGKLQQAVETIFLRIRNSVDYPLRQAVRWHRAGFKPITRSKQNLFQHLPPEKRTRAEETARRLFQDFHLDAFYQDSSPINYRENLFYLSLLENAFQLGHVHLPPQVNAADIGPSHWFYVQALAAFLRWYEAPQERTFTLAGFEADAYRVYGNFHSRYDHAIGHMRGLPGVTYVPRGFEAQPGQYDLITLFFPFVFEPDHLRWGLPATLFQPDRLLKDAWDSLKPGGALVIVNQGLDEHQAQGERMEKAGIQSRCAFHQDSLLFEYGIERYGWVAIHD
jgi:SAM-dependent methyltransferase